MRSIDFTGSNTFGRWLIDNARQAQVYAELAGVNNVVIESTDNYKAMLKNLAFTLSLYSGQMCTTTQDIFVPAGGIDTDEGHKSFDDVASDLGRAVDKLLSDAAVATAVLGSIQSPDTLKRIEEAPALRGRGVGVAQAGQRRISGRQRAHAAVDENRCRERVGVHARALRPDQFDRQGARCNGGRSRCPKKSSRSAGR